MARPLQVLSLLYRLGARSVMPSVSITSCRFASKALNKAQSHVRRDKVPNRAQRDSEEMSDEELEDVEDKLQVLFNEQRQKQKTVKYHILRRQMTPPGAPQRKLTWDAIEQIKYLKQEQPEEWTVKRLAEGYSVSPDVIRRVLRSKFLHTPERKFKQDTRALSGLGQQVLPSGAAAGKDRLKLSGNRTTALLEPGDVESAMVPVADKTVMLCGESSGLVTKSPAPFSLVPAQFRADVSKDIPVTTSIEEDSIYNTNPTEEDEDEDEEDEESWDGRLFTEEELEEIMETVKACPVVQDGNEFFDAEGNFLYRI